MGNLLSKRMWYDNTTGLKYRTGGNERMSPRLRTQIDFPDALWAEAKKAAVDERVPLNHLVCVAVRDYLGSKVKVERRTRGRKAKKVRV